MSVGTTRYTIPEHVVGEVLDSEAVLLNLNTGVYFGLNETGTRVWQLLTESVDLTGVTERLAIEFDADPASIRADVTRLLAELTERGLVEAEPPLR